MAKGIYKRGNVYWIRYAGPDGIIIRESTGSTKFRDAQLLLIKRKQEISEGKLPERKRIGNHTFNELAVEYLKWAERQRGFEQKRNIIGQLLKVFGNYPLRRFNTKTLEHYQTERMRKGNKPATINRHIATIKHMMTKAADWDLVEEEVLKRTRKVKMLEENNQRLRYLSTEECNDLIDACAEHLRPIVITAINTGMRRSEILFLRWEDVDLRHGFIHLEHTKNGQRREIPVNATLRETFQSIIRRMDVPFVFFDPKTTRPYNCIKKSFHSACKRAGLKDFKFHDLRHTFASQLVMAGIDLRTVMELLGHKTLTMTLRYSHLAPSHKVNAVNVLDSTLNQNQLHNYCTIPQKEEVASHV